MWEVVVVAKPGVYGGPAPKSKIGGGRAPPIWMVICATGPTLKLVILRYGQKEVNSL